MEAGSATGECHIVTVQPRGVVFAVPVGQTVFAAAVAQGLRWPTICGGAGSCGICAMTVLDGKEHLSEMTPWEREGLSAASPAGRAGGTHRLVCQTQIRGDTTVSKRGVRPA